MNLANGPLAGVGMTSAGANSASWVSRVVAANPNGAGGQILDSVNTVPGVQTLTIIQGTGSGSRSSSYILLDITGAAASPFDTSTANDNGYSANPASYTASGITAGATNELLVNVSGNQYQTVTTMQGGPGYNSLSSYEVPNAVEQEVPCRIIPNRTTTMVSG